MSGQPDKKEIKVNKEAIKEIYELLKVGEKKTKLSPGADIVLLLGNTGAGKSTLLLFLTGGNLESIEIGHGTGEFKIIDHENKVSVDSTIVSKTIFPDFLYDHNTNTTYYDCPGFADTRSAGHEISAAFFTKKVIDHAKSVKLVIAVNYHSLREGLYRNDFLMSLKYVTNLVRDVHKYKDSFALIGTKVDSKYVKGQLVQDENVILGIANFLKIVKDDIQRKGVSQDDSSDHRSEMIALLDSLLLKEEDIYRRIGIFRRPDEAGKLTEVKILKTGKKNIENIISKNLIFKEVKQDDFHYSITSDAKLYVKDLVKAIFNDMTVVLEKLMNRMNQIYEEQESNMTETAKIEEMFNALYQSFSKLKNDADNRVITEKEFKIQSYAKADVFKAQISSDYKTEITKLEEYIDFLNSMSNSSMENKSPELAMSLRKLLDYLGYSRSYYGFLNKLYEKLTQYDTQRNKNTYIMQNITKISDIAHSSVNRTLSDILRDYTDISNIELDEPKRSWLKKILEITLKPEFELNCHTYDTLVVKGRYINLREVDLGKCGDGIKYVYIFALEKIFIDTTLDLTGKEIQLAILAPVWDVQGSQSIILDGKSGFGHRYQKALGGIVPGENGSDGIPGIDGGPAGSFLGIGTQVINGEYLTISAKGGNGGRGQDGGDGQKGADGNDCASCAVRPDNLKIFLVYNEDDKVIMGQEGGNGGNGGRGGLGGYKGKVMFLEVGTKEMSKVNIDVRDGYDGEHGRGGKGGSGGRYYKEKLRSYLMVMTGSREAMDKWAKSGFNGLDGHKRENIQNPWKITNTLYVNEVKHLYVSYIDKNLIKHPKESFLRTFLYTLGNTRKRRLAINEDYEKKIAQFQFSGDYVDSKNHTDMNSSIETAEIKHINRNSNNERQHQNYDEPRALDWTKERISDDVPCDTTHDDFVTNGSASLNQNSIINKFFVFILQTFSSFNAWDLFINKHECGPILHFQRSYYSSKSPVCYLSQDKMALNRLSGPAYMDDGFSGCEALPLLSSQSNLLLWDTILKKFTGRGYSLSKTNRYHNEKRIDYATNLAYRYYTPQSKKLQSSLHRDIKKQVQKTFEPTMTNIN